LSRAISDETVLLVRRNELATLAANRWGRTTPLKARCDDFLNPAFDSWKTGGATDELAKPRALVGTFDWAIVAYKADKKYTKRPPRTRADYDRALNDVADYALKDGRRFGSLNVKSASMLLPSTVYNDKLRVKNSVRRDRTLCSRSRCASSPGPRDTRCQRSWRAFGLQSIAKGLSGLNSPKILRRTNSGLDSF
jgi:hypothetical protein